MLAVALSCQLRVIAVLRLLASQYTILMALVSAQLAYGCLNGLLGPSLLHLVAQVLLLTPHCSSLWFRLG